VSLVFITPEKLAESTRVANILKRLRKNGQLARFIIDEAHCVSQWGHDFRSSYLKLKNLKAAFDNVPITALTATATPGIAQDVQAQLRMTETVFIKGGINRANLSYRVMKKSRSKIMNDILQLIKLMDTEVQGKASGIVYCVLRSARRRAAGRVIVATIAFGMGINKPDVRFVIHYGLSKTMEGYYQESGRAGRDGYPSLAVLFYDYQDKVKQDVMIRTNVTSRNLAAADQAEKKIDSLLSMVEYCENRSICRRKLIAKHFNIIDVPTCREDEGQEPCDICSSNASEAWELADQTAAARKVLEVVRAAQGGGLKKPLGLNTLKDICIGSKSKNLSAYPHLTVYSNCLRNAKICSAPLTGDLALTFLRRMVTQRWLHERCERMEQGNCVGYLEPGRNITGNFTAYVPQRKKPTEPQGSKRQRLSYYFDKQTVQSPSNGNQNDWSKPSTINPHINFGLETKLREALRALRETLREEHNLARAYTVFNENTVIGCIQRLPQSIKDLEGIPGLGAQRMKKYGERIVTRVADVLNDRWSASDHKTSVAMPSSSSSSAVEMTEEYEMLNGMDEATLREFAFDGG
ncbi:hypothetical protein FOZ63_016093, partial [Perkinsus olseni]